MNQPKIPMTVAAALARGCFFCGRSPAPETAIMVAASWELVGAPQSRSEAQPAICCPSCFEKHAFPKTASTPGPEQSRYVLFNHDQDILLTTKVFNSYDEAALTAEGLNDVLILALPIAPGDEPVDCKECETPGQPFYSGVPGIIARVENGLVVPGTKVECCDACERFESDDAALEKLHELGIIGPEAATATACARVAKATVPATNELLAALADFVQRKAEAGRIEWEDDAPVFWGMLEEAEAVVTANVVLTPAQVRFFEVEIANRADGVSPATLDSAVESLDQTPMHVIVEWCGDEPVTEEMAPNFVASVLDIRDRLGGDVQLRELLAARRPSQVRPAQQPRKGG